MKKTLIIIVSLAVILAAIAGVATIVYANSDEYQEGSLPDGMTINGVDCSGMTYEEAQQALTENRNSKHLRVTGKLGETLADYTDFGCEYDIEEQLNNIKKDHLLEAALGHYFHLPVNAQIAMPISKCSDDFAKAVKNSEFLDRGIVTETQDAYIDMDDPSFPIIPEVYGNKTDESAYLADVVRAICMGSSRFEFDENAYLSIPEVKSDDPDLIAFQKYCKK